MRGQILNIDDKKIFTFSGARSHDISGGLLNPEGPGFKSKKKQLDKGWQPYRIKHDYTVDYIITHCCSTGTQEELGCKGVYEPDKLTDYFEFIKNYANYKYWFFGHYHDNVNVNDKELLLYEQIIQII